MTLHKTYIEIDNKVIGTDIKVKLCLDLILNVEPCFEICKGNFLSTCLLYLDEFKSIQADKAALQPLLKEQHVNRAIFKYNNINLIFYKSKKHNKTRVKLISYKRCYLENENNVSKWIILSTDDFNLLLRHYRTIMNMVDKQKELINYFKEHLISHLNIVFQRYFLMDNCNEHILNYCKNVKIDYELVTNKSMRVFETKYRKLLPLLMKYHVL